MPVIRNKDITIPGVGLTLFFCLLTGIAFAKKPPSNNSAPSAGTISPSSGTVSVNTAISYTRAYYDANGWQDFLQAQFLINTPKALTNCFYGYYDQNTNKFYLRNDTNKSWLGAYAIGSANIVQNSYVSLDCFESLTSGNGTTFWYEQVLIHKGAVNPC